MVIHSQYNYLGPTTCSCLSVKNENAYKLTWHLQSAVQKLRDKTVVNEMNVKTICSFQCNAENCRLRNHSLARDDHYYSL